MTRLFGYLLPRPPAERSHEFTAFGKEQTGHESAAAHGENVIAFGGGASTGKSGGVLVTLVGRPLWRGTACQPGTDHTLVAEIAAAYLEHQERVLDWLDGPFAIAILDAAKRSALLAVDRMGIERLVYAPHGGGIVFGESATTVAAFPGIDRRLRHQALYDFLFMHMVPAPGTVYEGIYKLPRATALTFRNNECRLTQYWQPRYDYRKPREFETLKRELMESLTRAVDDAGVDGDTGAFLSGGLDSSTVAGVLARRSTAPARTFTVGFGEADYDELRYARIASRHFACQAFEYHLGPADIVAAFARIAESYDEPFGNSSALPTFYCAKLAADNGVTHLLAGDGGDELFGGNERYVKQRVFELYGRAPEWLRHGLIEPALRLVDPDSRLVPLRKLKSYVDQARIPLPERFETWNFVYREGRTRLLDEEFAATIDVNAPLVRQREVWRSAPSASTLERMLWYDWQFTLADNDLRKVGTMCTLAGVRVSYPMLHPNVVAVSTRVPPSMKIENLELRSFYKNAMRGFLPEETLRKTKHGFGLPFGVWLKTDRPLRDLIYTLLTDLKKRRIVSARFISELIDEHRAGHASYYGYVIWDLAMLEAWLARHLSSSAAPSPAG